VRTCASSGTECHRSSFEAGPEVQLLPSIVGPSPVIVLCGMAGAESTKHRDHYYASPGNSFWESMHRCGLTPERLRPEQDHRITEHRLGLTDLVGHWDHESNGGWVEIDLLLADLERWQPRWLAFTGKGTAGYAARALGHRKPGLGATDWEVAGSQVFVLPGTSGANQRRDYDGRPDRLSWWRELAEITQPDF
jgi:TDG/mug DNA glycosylase family protein